MKIDEIEVAEYLAFNLDPVYEPLYSPETPHSVHKEIWVQSLIQNTSLPGKDCIFHHHGLIAKLE